MEGVTSNIYRYLKSLWRRRGYQRINVAAARRCRSKAELGRTADPNRRRRFWKIKIVPKQRIISPRKLFIGFRDAYVNFMMRLASSPGMVGGGGGGFGALEYGFGGFGMRPVKEYDEKVIVEIYKSIVMAQGKMVVRDGTDIDSRVVCAPKVIACVTET